MGDLWCSGVYSLLLTAFCFTTPTKASILPAAEATRVNAFLSGIVSGGYAAEAVGDVLEDLPILNALPLQYFSLEDEFAEFIERESSRYARGLVRERVGALGLSGPLSLTSSGSRGGPSGIRRGTSPRTRVRAHVSNRRLGLSLLFRF